MNKPIQSGFWFKVAVLSISLITSAATVVSPALPGMVKYFSDRSVSQVETLVTVPNLTIMITILLSSFIIRKFGTSQTVMCGLVIVVFSSIIPLFVDNYLIVLISRLLFGIGIGLFNTLAYSLVMQLYRGQERQTMLGIQNGMSMVGQTIMLLVIGMIVQYNWRVSFLVYLIAIIPLFLFVIFGRKINKLLDSQKQEIIDTSKKDKQSTNGFVIFYTACLTVFMISFVTFQLKLSGFIIESGLGNENLSASLLSIFSIIGIISSFCYGIIYKLLGRFTIPIGLFLFGLSYALVTFSQSITWLVMGVILVGFFFSLVLPAIFGRASELQPKGSDNLTSTTMLIGVNIGIFLTPSILGFIGSFAGMTSNKGSMILSIIFIMFLALVQCGELFLEKRLIIRGKQNEL